MKTNFIEDEIVSIECVGEVDTIDICVSNDNLFVANNILTHNSGYHTGEPKLEAISESMALPNTADFMAGIYQDDTDRQLGIIKMGLMKNRFGPNYGTCAMKMAYSILTAYEDETVSNTESSNSAIATLAALTVDKSR